MKAIHRLAVGLLCVVMAAMLIVPAAAYGCCGGRRGGYGRNTQTPIAVCPYEDCTLAGRHFHDGVPYCGYHHAAGCCGRCRCA